MDNYSLCPMTNAECTYSKCGWYISSDPENLDEGKCSMALLAMSLAIISHTGGNIDFANCDISKVRGTTH